MSTCTSEHGNKVKSMHVSVESLQSHN